MGAERPGRCPEVLRGGGARLFWPRWEQRGGSGSSGLRVIDKVISKLRIHT